MFIPNKYYSWYSAIIERAKLRPALETYHEIHHIVPRCLGGTNDPTNLVALTAREHFICHALLVRFVADANRYKVIHAFIAMKGANGLQHRYFNARLYESARVSYSNHRSIVMQGEGNHFFGKKHTPEARKKISSSKRGRPNNSWNTGHTKESSEKLAETSLKIKDAKRGSSWWNDGSVSITSVGSPGLGWVSGRLPFNAHKWSDEDKMKRVELNRNGKLNWRNNGKSNKRCREQPDVGWVRGKLTHPKGND